MHYAKAETSVISSRPPMNPQRGGLFCMRSENMLYYEARRRVKSYEHAA